MLQSIPHAREQAGIRSRMTACVVVRGIPADVTQGEMSESSLGVAGHTGRHDEYQRMRMDIR